MEAVAYAHPDGARARVEPEVVRELANHRQEPWKQPLPEFIASLYVKRFGMVPDVVRTIEEVAAAEMAKREAKKMRKLAPTPSSPTSRFPTLRCASREPSKR
jgi:hypothetical protein